jgi:hypothetical protein
MDNEKQASLGTGSVNGTELYYERMGKGHPCLLIHPP